MAFENYLIHLGILVCIYSILTIALNFAVGFTGLLNLGHIAFFGLGAYTSALLVRADFPIAVGIMGGIAVAAIAGALLALPTSRLKGDYLALATLGFTFIMQSVARNWTDLTRGALGLPGIPKMFANNLTTLIVFAIIALASYLCFAYIARSRFGKTCEAVRDDELATKMLGKNTFTVKIKALAISAAFAGLAGAMFAHYITFIDPTVFILDGLILLFSMMIIGGLASVKGAFIGTFIILLIPEPLRFLGLPSALIGPAREMLFALILILILIYRPRGLFGRVDLA